MRRSLLSAIGFLVVGCAGEPAPTEQVASALAAVRGAEEAGALGVPQAALHVKLAEEQVEKAQALMSDEENGRAASLALRASEDAELAIALARESATQKQLDEFAQANTSGGEQSAAPEGAEPAPRGRK